MFETHYNAVLSNVNVGADLCCVDHAVLLDEDVISDVQREKRHPGGSREKVSGINAKEPTEHLFTSIHS